MQDQDVRIDVVRHLAKAQRVSIAGLVTPAVSTSSRKVGQLRCSIEKFSRAGRRDLGTRRAGVRVVFPPALTLFRRPALYGPFARPSGVSSVGSGRERALRTYPCQGCRCSAHSCHSVDVTGPITVVAVLVNQYVMVEFDNVCQILHGFVSCSPSPRLPAVTTLTAGERSPSLEFAGPLRLVSRELALLAVRLQHQSLRNAWRLAEIRIIKVESGPSPVTELLLVLPFPASAESACNYIQEVARRVEERSAYITPLRHRASSALGRAGLSHLTAPSKWDRTGG